MHDQNQEYKTPMYSGKLGQELEYTLRTCHQSTVYENLGDFSYFCQAAIVRYFVCFEKLIQIGAQVLLIPPNS